MDPELIDTEQERHSLVTPTTPSQDASSDARRKLHRSHTLRLNKPQLAHSLPHLDVLSLHSRRLVSQTQDHIAAHEAVNLKKYPRRQGWPSADHNTTDDDSIAQLKLEELLESVHLLVEPIQIPDLSHTGVFYESTSQLQNAVEIGGSVAVNKGAKLSLSSFDKESDVKLFYPTGAKKANMREYIQEIIQCHLATSEELLIAQSYVNLPFNEDDDHEVRSTASKLGASASAPAFASHSQAVQFTNSTLTPSKSLKTGPKSAKKTSKASPSPTKHKKSKFLITNSPQKISSSSTAGATCGSPMLNPELTRQAKDIIAAIRANSSKINELMTS